MQNHWETYSYVDACWHDPVTKTRSTWIRCHLNNFDRLVVEPGHAVDCFASVQHYRDAARDTASEVRAELPSPAALHGAPPAVLAAAGVNGTNGAHYEPAEAALASVAPEAPPFELPQRQMHYHGLYFDLDVPRARRDLPRDETLAEVQKDALRLAQFFLEALEVPPPCVQVWFSGSKGFHVLVRPEALEMEPQTQLTYAVKQVATELKNKLLLTNLDLSVYTISRMWRVTNTVHSSTGLYKIELTVNELAQLPIHAIMSLAKGPRYA